MSYPPGTKLGPYEILAPLGAGGMGEVYRARDTRLDRTVAVKVLPSHLSSDPALRDRFEREARAVSSLNHPNICALYDIGEQDGVSYLVMEHIEGETLAARLSRGALPTDLALRVATEIADALDKAHRQGVVHRDLKPANIMLTKSGSKLLDFGLAKLKPSEPAGAVPGSSALLTQRADLTMQGSIVGTLQYMAPEQLEGKEADPRSDIFSFGSVLYEMVTGRKAFEGKSQASVIAAILTLEPQPVSSIQPMTPPALDRVVQTCLAKDAEDRWQSARDLTSELKWISQGGSQAGSQSGAPAQVATRRRGRERIAWMVAGALAIALALAGAWIARRPAEVQPAAVRFTFPPPTNSTFDLFMALSPDGSRLAFVSSKDGRLQLWIRPLNSYDSIPLAGTEGATQPFWAPDGRSIGFFADGKLKRIDTLDGTVQSIAPVTEPRGGAWGPDGTIILTPSTTQPLFQVSSQGGSLKPLTKLAENSKESSHRWPWFLPDGRHFLYLVRSGDKEAESICLGSLDSAERVTLAPAHSSAIYASGHILYVRDKTLVAQAFDAKRLKLSGEPISVAQNVELVGEGGPTAWAAITAASNGLLGYLKAGSKMDNTLTWFDRSGKEINRPVPLGNYSEPSRSPDGRRVAAGVIDPKSGIGSIWLVDLSDGRLTRFTFGADDGTPTWSPDGSRIVYSSNREGVFDLYIKASSGVTPEEPLLKGPTHKFVDSWSPDGRFIVYELLGENSNYDLWLLPMAEKGSPRPFLVTPATEAHSAVSPDSRWIAYGSDESGRAEVYVQTFPTPGGKFQISTQGGDQPLWRDDGKELYFISANRMLTAVSVTTGATFEAGAPRDLFPLRMPAPSLTGPHIMYVASPDGQRFLVASYTEESVGEPMRLILNWPSELKR